MSLYRMIITAHVDPRQSESFNQHSSSIHSSISSSAGAMDRLLIIEPKDLILKLEVGEKSHATIHLKNVMYTMPVAYEVQPSAPKRYTIKPTHGIICPLGVAVVEITLSPQMQLPVCVPYSEDKFLVKSVVVPGGADNTSISLDWFSAKRKQVFSDHGMRVFFIGGGILRKLVEDGCMEAVREVLELDDNLVDSKDDQGHTSMHIAVACGRPDLVQLLLEFRAGLEVKSNSGQTVLQEAASRGEALIVELFLARGAKVDARTSLGRTALHKAVLAGHADVVRLLLENGADVNALAENGQTAVHMAVDAGRHDCLEMLLKRGAKVNARGGGDRNVPLHRATARGDGKAMEILLRYGACTELKNKKGKTPRDLAKEGQQGLVLFDVLILGDDLRRASRKGKVIDIQQSLRKGAVLDGEDEHGWTALHRAAFKGHMAVVRALLEAGSALECKDDAGYTPLHCAAEAGNKDIIKLLLKHGARVNACTCSGHTTLDLATFFKYPGIVSLLHEWGGFSRKGAKGMKVEGGFPQKGEKGMKVEGGFPQKGEKGVKGVKGEGGLSQKGERRIKVEEKSYFLDFSPVKPTKITFPSLTGLMKTAYAVQ